MTLLLELLTAIRNRAINFAGHLHCSNTEQSIDLSWRTMDRGLSIMHCGLSTIDCGLATTNNLKPIYIKNDPANLGSFLFSEKNSIIRKY